MRHARTFALDDMGAGVATVHANYTMDLATGDGNLWGTVVYDLGDGGFTSTFSRAIDSFSARSCARRSSSSLKPYAFMTSLSSCP